MLSDVELYSKILKLAYTKQHYQEIINEAMNNNSSYEDFLKLILKYEINYRNLNSINNRIKNAKFPYLKTFEEFDFNAFSLDIANKIRELQSLSFIDQGQNVILIGNPGVGKTHTAIALGIKACNAGKNVYILQFQI